MAGESRLRDAKIEVKVDTEAARRAIDDLETGRDRGRSRPGERPPSPGRKDERREREREDRERRGRKPGRIGTALTAGAAARGAGRLGSVAKAGATGLIATIAASAATMALDSIQGMLTEWRKQMDNDFAREITKTVEAKLNAAAATVRAGVTGLVATGATVGASLDLAKSQLLLMGEVRFGDIGLIAYRAGQLAAIRHAQEQEKSAQGRRALGAAGQQAIQNLADKFSTAK